MRDVRPKFLPISACQEALRPKNETIVTWKQVQSYVPSSWSMLTSCVNRTEQNCPLLFFAWAEQYCTTNQNPQKKYIKWKRDSKEQQHELDGSGAFTL